MNEFVIAKAGVSTNGTNWSMITKTDSGFLLRAFVRTEKPTKEGDKLAVPSALVSKIDWQF